MKTLIIRDNCILKDASLSVDYLLIHPGVVLNLVDSKLTVACTAVALGSLACLRSTFIAREAYRGFTGTCGELGNLMGLSLGEIWDLDAAIDRDASALGIL